LIGDIETTVVGNIAAAPELRLTPNGVAVAKVSIACTPRKREGDKWVDGATTWVRGTMWRELAEHAAESLNKGDRVIAQGTLTESEYEKDGTKHRVWEFEIRAIGPELAFATTTVTRAERTRSGGGRSVAREEEWGDAQPAGAAKKATPAAQSPAGAADDWD
jgi:single-strand DNA-binding protein